jgi:Virulence-associated protein E/VirE N-terminal domain/Primase C terminal 2 (PriCT-2)
MTKKSNSNNAFKEGVNSDLICQVSFFEKVKAKSCINVKIQDILEDIKNGKYRNQIEEIRSESDPEKKKFLKENLPAITVSGIFNNSHSAKDLIYHSGLIQIDLDHVDPIEVRTRLEKSEFTYCCFLSPSGNGLKLIVRIDPDSHQASFVALKSYFFNQFRLEIDRKCKDVGRCMFLSYDENLYLNTDSILFPTGKHKPVATNKGIRSRKEVLNTNTLSEAKAEDVELLITQIEENRVDITSGYDNWLKIGFALSETFGEQGRNYFQRLSIFNHDYSVIKTDSQYNKCLNSKKEGINLGTLFYIAKNYGITISNLNGHKSNEITSLNITDSFGESTCEKVENLLNKQYQFRCNEIDGEIEYKLPEDAFYLPLNEDNIHRFIQHNGLKFSLANLISLLRSDYVPKYNPFEDYFEGLPKWNKDSDPDHISQLASNVDAKDQIRFSKQFLKMLVRVIACALNEKVFNKHAFILVHDKQNSGKSTFCRFLCPPTLQNYISESFAMDKDSLISLSENIFINLDELSTLSKIEINTLKSMFTKDKIKIRKPYDKKATNTPRRCSFIGSTNKSEFLSDETGSVRWLCFEIEGIDLKYSKEINIDFVWSQAYSLYLTGFEYQLTKEELIENETANEKHFLGSIERDLITQWLIPCERNFPDAVFKTTTELAEFLNTQAINLNWKYNPITLGKALKSLGFKQDQASTEKDQRKGYYVIIYKDGLLL